MTNTKSSDEYNKAETEKRAYDAIKRALTTPHKPHKPLKNAVKKKKSKTS